MNTDFISMKNVNVNQNEFNIDREIKKEMQSILKLVRDKTLGH